MNEKLQKEIDSIKDEIAAGPPAQAAVPAPTPTVSPTITPPTAPTAARKPKLSPKLQAALAVFTLAGGLAAAILPNIAKSMGNTDQPTMLQISLTGVVLILITSVLLGYASKIIGLSKSWLLMAITYNSLIILMKFIISPTSLYGQTFTLDFLTFDPNSKPIYLFVASFIALLYIAVFALLYRRHKKKLAGSSNSINTPKVARKPLNTKSVIVVIALVVLCVIGGGGLILAPLLAVVPSLNYLNYAFSGAMGLALLVALVFTILTASMSFQSAEATALKMRDSTILATFFWLGLSMILIYHALWVVFMTIMVSIWPLKTISPSGK